MTIMTAPARVRLPDLFLGMNGTEREHAISLEAQKRDGLIREWRYEEVTLCIGSDCRYTPDFFVVEADGAVRFDETKGFWRDDARAKIRAAARHFPFFRFRALEKRSKKDGGGWRVVEIEP